MRWTLLPLTYPIMATRYNYNLSWMTVKYLLGHWNRFNGF